MKVFQLHPVALQSVEVQFRLGQDILVQEFPEIGDLVHAGTHLEHFIEFLAQRTGRAANAKGAADAVTGFAGAARIRETADCRFEVLLRAGRTGARVDEGQHLEGAAIF